MKKQLPNIHTKTYLISLEFEPKISEFGKYLM